MNRVVILKIRPDLLPHTRRRALAGVGSMASVELPHPSPDRIIDGLGGVRPASRAAGLGLDTVK